MPRLVAACFASLLLVWLLTLAPAAALEPPRDLPAAGWQSTSREVQGRIGEHHAAVGYPKASAAVLRYAADEVLAPGLYELSLDLAASETHQEVAWTSTLRFSGMGAEAAWPLIHFARDGQPETRTLRLLVTRPTAAAFTLELQVEGDALASSAAATATKSGVEPRADAAMDLGDGSGAGGGLDPGLTAMLGDLKLDPKRHVYVTAAQPRLRLLAVGGAVRGVAVDKLRYTPGATAAATVTVQRLGPPADGRLMWWLESALAERGPVASQPLRLEEPVQTVALQVPVDGANYGYALRAAWLPAAAPEADADALAAAACFTVSDRVYRTAIHYVRPVTGETFATDPAWYDAHAQRLMADYQNIREIFFWAEEDMVELTPDDPYWFSGQTAYHLSGDGLKAMIAAYHRHGIAAATYGKFIMSGYLGWRHAYDYPQDHTYQYRFPLGMWEATDVLALDRFMNKEMSRGSAVKDPLLDGMFYLPFLPIDPDPTPRNVYTAAQEVIESARTYGWDAVRWDGHPRALGAYGNSIGGQAPDKYNYQAHRQTQLLVRYFKDLVNAAHPGFGHGYNYLHADPPPSYDWAVEDFELDELADGGGLLMNESIGNHGFGKPFSWFIGNLQEEGDLSRERGGFYLTIGHDDAPRDILLNTVLTYAAGARPYGSNAADRALNRYATRYADFVFDEGLRRLPKAGAFLKVTDSEGHPAPATLLWDSFVYETPRDAEGRSYLVLNLVNLDPQARTMDKAGEKPDNRMPPGTPPLQVELSHASFGLALEPLGDPVLIDPFTLQTTPLGGLVSDLGTIHYQLPSVAIWRVLVWPLQAGADAPTLASKFGPPSTLDKRRANLQAERSEPPPLDLEKDVVDVNKKMAALFPDQGRPHWQEDPALAAMSMAERDAELLQRKLPPKAYIDMYPYGVGLPPDQKLADDPPDFGDLTPARNGRYDIFYGRGAMDYRLRLYEAIARLPRFRVREATYGGSFNGKNHWLVDNIAPTAFAAYDLAIYTDVPHLAIGVQQSYALVDWVKAGGAALFVGGEYAFSKGRYPHTILDRELLPVVCSDLRDMRYAPEPLTLEPGPDFAALGVPADFSVQPRLWCWNEVALRPDADVKIFLQAGNRPILVGWELGAGRVACLLTTQRGMSAADAGVTAYFDWAAWPELTAALLRWLSPSASDGDSEAAAPSARQALTAAELEAVRNDFQGARMEALMNLEDDGLGSMTTSAAVVELEPKALERRVAQIRRLLAAPSPEASQLLAGQVVSVSNLPLELRLHMLTAIAAQRPPTAALVELARPALESSDELLRQCAGFLLAVADSPEFIAFMKDPRPTPSLSTGATAGRRVRAMALAASRSGGLQAQAREQLARYDRDMAAARDAYLQGEPWSMKNPVVPVLTGEAAFERLGWLAYAASVDGGDAIPAFCRAWCGLPQWTDFSRRAEASIRYAMSQGRMADYQKAQAEKRLADLREYRLFLAAMERLTSAMAQDGMRQQPRETAAALADLHFLQEGKAAINLLGDLPAAEGAAAAKVLAESQLPVIAAVARVRQEPAAER